MRGNAKRFSQKSLNSILKMQFVLHLSSLTILLIDDCFQHVNYHPLCHLPFCQLKVLHSMGGILLKYNQTCTMITAHFS